MASLDLPNAPRPPPLSTFPSRIFPRPLLPPADDAVPLPIPDVPPALARALAPVAFGGIARKPVCVPPCLARPNTPFPNLKASFGITPPPVPEPLPAGGLTPAEPLAPVVAPPACAFPFPPPPVEARFFPMLSLPLPLGATLELAPPRDLLVELTVGLAVELAVELAPPATGAPRLRRAVSPCRCRFNRSNRICAPRNKVPKTALCATGRD